jgi:DNA-binding NarL/FixJ family response regulator
MFMQNCSQIGILIAVDNEIVRAGLTQVIDAANNMTILAEACDAADALEKAKQLHPNVILLKMDLNDDQIVELAKDINRLTPESHILLLDFHCTKDDVFRLFPTGVHGYCLLNATIPKLQAAIYCVSDAVLWVGPGVIQEKVVKLPQSRVTGLSERENEVLILIGEGMTNLEIARKMGLSTDTVKTHVRHILDKMNVPDRTNAVLKAIREGMLVHNTESLPAVRRVKLQSC